MVEIATVGAHECLRSGVTTIGDCSFSGAAAIAAAATGLRAIVYLEVFSSDGPALERFHESHGRIETRALRPRAPRRLPACAVHLHDRDLPRLRRARPAAGDPLRRERRRARLAGRRDRGLEPAGGVPRAAVRRDRDPHAGGGGAARAGPDGRPLRACRRRGDRPPGRSTASASRTAPARTATSAAASRRCGSFATPAWPCRSRPTAPHRPRRSTSSRRSERRSSPRAPAKGGRMR